MQVKRGKNIIIVLIILAGIIWYSASRINWPVALDRNWLQPIAVTESRDTIWDWLFLYKIQGTIMCLQPMDKGAARCFFLTNNSWAESDTMNFPKDYFLQNLAIDQENKIAMLSDGNIANQRAEMKVLLAKLSKNGFENLSQAKWTIDERKLFGNTSPNVYFGGTNKYDQGSLSLATGIIDGSEIYVPYCAGAVTITTAVEGGPFNVGVFHSSDSGKTWQMEQISNVETWDNTICKTKKYYYYLGRGYKFWCSRKAIGQTVWESPL